MLDKTECKQDGIKNKMSESKLNERIDEKTKEKNVKLMPKQES